MNEMIRVTPAMSHEEMQQRHNVKLAVGGNKGAYSKLILGLEDKLYRVARSVLRCDADCADAIQETLIRGWLKLPSLKDFGLFEHWIIRILLRECYRIAKRSRPVSIENLRDVQEQKAQSEKTDLQQAINLLTKGQRVPVILHHIMGYKVSEIAIMMNLPEGTVKSRLMRGRDTLRQILKEEMKDED